MEQQKQKNSIDFALIERAKKGERAAVIEMRKHYAGYFRSIPHFKPYRTRLVELTTVADIEALLHEVAQHFG